jgi:putative ABC transport system permease protein
MSLRRSEVRPVEPSRMHLSDLVTEAMAGLVQRPARSLLTMLGTVLGIGAFVAILGLTATAGGQIDKRFSTLSATEVSVQDVGTGGPDEPISFPADADQRVATLAGVAHAGLWWKAPVRNPTIAAAPYANAGTSGDGAGLSLFAADPGALAAMEPTLSAGTLYNAWHEQHRERVAVLGSGAAKLLGISRLDAQPAVFVNGTPYTVVGIIDDLKREPELLLGVVIPDSTALAAYGQPADDRAHMLIETGLGAAQLVAHQAPILLRPDNTSVFKVSAPPDPHALRDNINHDFNALFLLLAGICLVIGAVGIANTTLVAVLERTPEIGLRRSLGARPRHIATQFLAESTALGTLGGLIGTSLGATVVVAVAIAQHWTAILQPWAVLPAPLIGTVIGLAAGLYPALRAAWIEPVEALRR